MSCAGVQCCSLAPEKWVIMASAGKHTCAPPPTGPKSPPRNSTTTQRTGIHTHTHTHTRFIDPLHRPIQPHTRPPTQPARASQATVVESQDVNPPRLDALEDRASSMPQPHRHHATAFSLYPRPTSPNLVNCPSKPNPSARGRRSRTGKLPTFRPSHAVGTSSSSSSLDPTHGRGGRI